MLAYHAWRLTRLAAQMILVLAGPLVLVSTGARAQAPLPGWAAKVRPYGLATVIRSDPTQTADEMDLSSIANDNISGVAFQIQWDEISQTIYEKVDNGMPGGTIVPVQGGSDFSEIERVLHAAKTHGKWVHLLISPGFHTPIWALHGVKTPNSGIPGTKFRNSGDTIPI